MSLIPTQTKESSRMKLMNSALTLRGLLEDKSNTAVVPLSVFSSFYSEREPLKPLKLYSVDYDVRTIENFNRLFITITQIYDFITAK